MEDVLEKHGIVQKDNCVVIDEEAECISITTNNQYAGRTVYLTPNEARYIASRLYRLARRVQARLLT